MRIAETPFDDLLVGPKTNISNFLLSVKDRAKERELIVSCPSLAYGFHSFRKNLRGSRQEKSRGADIQSAQFHLLDRSKSEALVRAFR